jgi:hypothetical protein
MAESAIAAHELYASFQDAGFTEAQAFELIKTMVAAGATNRPTDEE